jgi:hypothetical protein
MISNFKNSIYGLFVKILLGLVAFSLVFWGVGTSNSPRESFIAKIDKNHYIYTERFNQQKKNLVHSIVTMNPGISIDTLDVNSLVLNGMVQNKVLELELQRLGIFVSDEMAKNEIKKNRFFFDKKGNFDQDLFKRIVVNQGMTEKEYINQQKLIVGTQILDSAIIPFSTPESMAKDLYQYQNQSRKLNIIYITPKSEKNSSTPTQEELKKYYDAHQQDFTTPEIRDIEYVIISPRNFDNSPVEKKSLAVTSSENLMHKAMQAIEDDIASGDSLEKIAKKYKLSYYKIDKLSATTPQINNIKPEDRLQFISVAFENDDENSPSETKQISSTSNDYYIFNNKKIYPSKTLGLEQVKPQITAILNNLDAKTVARQSASSIYRKFVVSGNLNDFIKNNKNSITQESITASRSTPKINKTLLEESFNLKTIGAYTNLIQESDNKFVFAVLEKAITSPANNISAKDLAELKRTIAKAVDTATLNELMRYFYGQHTIEIKDIQNADQQA